MPVIGGAQQGDSAGEAERQAEFLLQELWWFLGYTPHPTKGAEHRLDHAADAGLDRDRVKYLRGEVEAGRAHTLSGDRALALKRFKEGRDGWMTAAKGE
jgi:hypothetical protein